jgi:tripartite-type tricarboxylate transporter receptor subunit TctC
MSQRAFSGYCLSVLLGTLALAPESHADAIADFYRSKTVTITWGGQEGGSNDVFTRLVATHIVKHIPGNPNSIVRYMPGAGGLRYANYLANVEPADGTYIGVLANDPIVYGMMFSSSDEVKFDAAKFAWIGSMARVQSVISVWREKGARSIEDAKTHEYTMSVTGIGSVNYQDLAIANNVVGTRFKAILGYQGAADSFLALDRGEVDGHADSWDAFYTHRPQWAVENKVVYLLQFGPNRIADLPDVPLITELATNAEDKAAAEFLTNIGWVGRPILAPPKLAPEKLQALRQAFIETMSDPDYIADAKKAKLDTGTFMAGDKVAVEIAKMSSASPAIKARAGALIKIPGQGN